MAALSLISAANPSAARTPLGRFMAEPSPFSAQSSAFM